MVLSQTTLVMPPGTSTWTGVVGAADDRGASP